MQIIFVVFGILPDPMIHLQDLVKQVKTPNTAIFGSEGVEGKNVGHPL